VYLVFIVLNAVVTLCASHCILVCHRYTIRQNARELCALYCILVSNRYTIRQNAGELCALYCILVSNRYTIRQNARELCALHCILVSNRYTIRQNAGELKELSTNLEHDRDITQRHLAAKETELERARATIIEMEREINLLKDRCNG